MQHPVSRLVVDPERFENDADEPMAQRGQGVLYVRGADGSVIRPAVPEDRRQWLLDRWYRPHHHRLTQAVDAALQARGRVLIIDAHSFPASPLPLDLDQQTPRPDACIGTAGMHTPARLIAAARDWCAQMHWSLGVDRPYAGSIVPLKHLGRSATVNSIMVEINRDRYMTLDNDEPERSDGFAEARAFVSGLMLRLREAAADLPAGAGA